MNEFRLTHYGVPFLTGNSFTLIEIRNKLYISIEGMAIEANYGNGFETATVFEAGEIYSAC